MQETPRGHFPTVHETFGRMGTFSLAQAFEALENRQGRKIRFKVVATLGTNMQRALDALERHHKLVETPGYRSFSKRQARKDARTQVNDAIAEAKFSLAPERLVAALALRYGLRPEELEPHVAEWNSIARNQTQSGSFVPGVKTPGLLRDFSWLLKPVRTGLLYHVQKLLHQKPEAVTTEQLAQELKTNVSFSKTDMKQLKADIVGALAILDTAGLSYKLPGENMQYRWIHGCFQRNEKTLPSWNLGWQILQELVNGPRMTGAFSKSASAQKFEFGLEEGGVSASSITQAFDRLKHAGLIHVEPVFARGRQARLTESGNRLLKEQARLNYLHPEIREALLLNPKETGELSIPVSRAVEKLLAWYAGKRALDDHRHSKGLEKEQVPTSGVGKISSETMLGEGFLTGVARGDLPKVSGKTLSAALAHLDIANPEAAVFLREKLNAPKEKLSE